jgi:hypothetical protein
VLQAMVGASQGFAEAAGATTRQTMSITFIRAPQEQFEFFSTPDKSRQIARVESVKAALNRGRS